MDKNVCIYVSFFFIWVWVFVCVRNPQALPPPQVTNHTSNATNSGRQYFYSFFVGLLLVDLGWVLSW